MKNNLKSKTSKRRILTVTICVLISVFFSGCGLNNTVNTESSAVSRTGNNMTSSVVSQADTNITSNTATSNNMNKESYRYNNETLFIDCSKKQASYDETTGLSCAYVSLIDDNQTYLNSKVYDLTINITYNKLPNGANTYPLDLQVAPNDCLITKTTTSGINNTNQSTINIGDGQSITRTFTFIVLKSDKKEDSGIFISQLSNPNNNPISKYVAFCIRLGNS